MGCTWGERMVSNFVFSKLSTVFIFPWIFLSAFVSPGSHVVWMMQALHVSWWQTSQSTTLRYIACCAWVKSIDPKWLIESFKKIGTAFLSTPFTPISWKLGPRIPFSIYFMCTIVGACIGSQLSKCCHPFKTCMIRERERGHGLIWQSLW